MRVMVKGLLLTLALMGAGCASVPLAPPEEDTAAKQFEAPEEKAALYIYRDQNFGGALKLKVTLDDKPLGATAPKTYFRTEVEPGSHVIKGIAENKDTVTLEAEAGQVYFIWQQIKMGIMSARNDMQLVDEQKGKAGVSKSKLILMESD